MRPVPTEEKSLWLRQALGEQPPEPRALMGTVRAHVCIVGGGYTGLWTALRLKELEPSCDVVLVEADLCGSGASGRNGGFVLSLWSKFLTLQKLCGSDEALRLARASARSVDDIGWFCATHGIDAEYRRDGWIWAATNRAQLGSWSATVEELDKLGEHPFVELGPDDAARRTGSPVHLNAALEATGAGVQPAKLALGLRRAAIERGARIFERSPMLGLARGGPDGGWQVGTATGSVHAPTVVLAMNAWSVRIRQLRPYVLVVGSDIVATDPAPDRLADIGWTDGACISDGRLLVHYYRTTTDGRLVFGKGGGLLPRGPIIGPRFDGRSRRADTVEAAFRSTYPSLADVAITSHWTGPIDRTRSGLPTFGQLDGHPRVFYGMGYSGNGVGPSFLGGRILASLALGDRDEWATCGLVRPRERRFPPEPVRFVGGSMVRAAIARVEAAEDAGRRPRGLDRRLMRLAPAGLVPTGRGKAAALP